MLGAIIGDVVGSRFEFNNIKSKHFKLVDKGSTFTDDSVLTIAVMDWLLHSSVKCNKTATEFLQKWARKYPNAGYGGMFYHWKDESNPKPYNSCGNGSAMRISGVGWVSDDMVETKLLSDIITGVTHNHPEGLKGAFVTSQLIYMARMGKSKEEMKEFAKQFYDFDFDYEELKKNYLAQIPAGRFGEPDDIANACVFLASDEASYINGQVLHINGGLGRF